MSSKDVLLEIGTEPLPARFCRPALDQLLAKTEAALKENRLAYESAEVLGTYRRLTVIVSGVADKSETLDKEVQGPPARLLKDPATGAFTAQAEGFARKNGLEPEELGTVQTPKGEFLLARVAIPGEPAAAILARILPQIIASLEFPKTLEWEESRFRFGRPIRTLTALLGRSVVPFKLAGIKSNRLVAGLPAQAKKPLPLSEPSKYREALKKLLVLVDPEERRDALLKRLAGEAKRAGGEFDRDGDLVEETVWMTEHPVPVAGRFKDEFLELPAPLLSLVQKKQLKFFPLLQGKKLMAGFLGVRDGVSEGQALVREGYQRVISARLSDAVFFFGRDKAATLASRLPMLDRVTYQKALGSMANKGLRVRELAHWFCQRLRQASPLNEAAVTKIAELCYADLPTDVVKEFPELQGAMGGVYARLEGLDERVALGLEEFYFPVGPKNPIPTTLEGALVSLAGKLDSLAGQFAVGNAPTGSADPFALRRQAFGVVRIMLEKQIPVDLDEALAAALDRQPASCEKPKVARELSEFVWGRAQSFFEERGFKVDEVRSVRAGGLTNLAKTYLRLAAVASVRKNPDFEPLAAAFKRASNILKQAKIDLSNGAALPDRGLLKEEAELKLYDALVSMEADVREKLVCDGYEPGLRALVAIKPHLDLFFDKVMVMVDDPVLKAQRLSLLAKLVKLFRAVADLSELKPSGGSS